MIAPRRLQLRRGNTAAVSSYLGAAGELIVNTDNNTLYVHDGVTVGGYATTVNVALINSQITAVNANITQANVGMRGYVDFSIRANIANIAPGYTNTNVKSYLGAFDGNLIPSANVTYSLGNVTHQWNDLYVSNNTIYVGGVPLSIDNTGNLTINGNTIPTIGYVNTVVANVTVDLSSYALNANVTAANVGLKGYVDQANTIQSAQLTSANLGIIGYIDRGNTIQSAQIAAANVGLKGYVDQGNTIQAAAITSANVGMRGYVDTAITANIALYGNLQVSSVDQLSFGPGESYSFLYMKNDGSETRLANDGGNVQISSGGVSTYYWTFDNNGNLTFPDNTVQTTAFSNSAIATYFLDGTPKSFAGNLTIEGNLFVNGNVNYISVNNFQITDNIINLADLNPADSLDLGITGHRTINGVIQHVGLVRDASANQWRLFSNVVPNPGTTVDFTDAIYDDLQLGNITSPTIDSLTLANTIQTQQIAAANIGIIGYIDQGNTIQSEAITAANVGMKGYVDSQISAGSYGNAQVATYLQFGNIANVSVAGNVTATRFRGNGALLTGIMPVTTNTSANYNIVMATGSNASLVTGSGNGGTAATLNPYTGQMSISGLTIGGYGVSALTGFDYVVTLNGRALTFTQTGNLIVPGNVYANSATITGNVTANYFVGNGALLTGIVAGSNYSNVQVAAYLNTNNYSPYSNVNVAAYLSTATINTTGNITAQYISGNISITGNVTGTSPNVTLQAGAYTSVFDNQGNVTLPSAYVTGNVSANYFVGNGALLTGIVAGSNYSNVQVATYLPTYSGNVANLTVTDTLTLTATKIALGQQAGQAGAGQGTNSVAIGYRSGYQTQGNSAVAIGLNSGNQQGDHTVAIGASAGGSQTQQAVAVGSGAAQTGQALGAVAIGYASGQSAQGLRAVAIGAVAGNGGQGAQSIAIGHNAGYSNQPANSIEFNATGTALDYTNLTAGLYITSVKQDTANVTNVVYYNTTTKEITYGPASGGSGGSNYSNVNVAAYISGTSAIFTGNTNTLAAIQANISQVFIGNSTALTSGSGQNTFFTYLLNNIYYDAAGLPRYRNAAPGAASLYMAGTGFQFAGQNSTVTANASAAGIASWATITSSGISTFNSASISAAGNLSAALGGLNTTATQAYLYNATATTINMGGAATTIRMGTNTSNVFVGRAIGNANRELLLRAQGTWNTAINIDSNGGFNSPPYTNQLVIGGSGTGMTANYNATGGYLNSVTIYNPGTGYQNGDVLSVPGGIAGNSFTLTNYSSTLTGNSAAAYTFGIEGNLTVPGNVTARNFIGSGALLTSLPGYAYSNVNVAAYAQTMGYTNYSNVNVQAYTESMGFANYSNVNVSSYLGATQITVANIKLNPSGNIIFSDGTVQTTASSGGGLNILGNTSGNATFYIMFTSSTGSTTTANISNPTLSWNPYLQTLESGQLKARSRVTAGGAFPAGAGSVHVLDGSDNVKIILDAATGNVSASGNVIAGGILTDNYYYANGTPVSFGGGSSYSNVQVATYLPTYSGNIANIRLGVAGVLTFADGTTMTSAAAGTYSNVQVATYLPTYGGAIQSSNVQTTTANIQATTASTNTATGALRVMGGVGVAGTVFAGQLNTTGNLIANAISAYSLNTVANVTASVVSAGTINSAGNVLAQNIIGTIATASQTGITAVGTLVTLSVTGNATVGNLVGNEANTRIIANAYVTTFDIYGNVTFPGNVIAPYFIGDGSLLTGIVSGGGSSYGNSNVAQYLPTYSGNIANIRLGSSGVLTFADGTTQITAGGGGYSNVQVATYLPTYSGNIGGNISIDGTLRINSANSQPFSVNDALYVVGGITSGANISAGGRLVACSFAKSTSINSGAIQTNGGIGAWGNLYIGESAFIAGNAIVGVTGYTVLPTILAQFTGNANTYTQLNIQNISTGSDATAEYVATANNGTDTTFFVDMGIANSNYDVNSPNNSLGTTIYPNDSYLYAQGNLATTTGGNLAIGTSTAGKSVKIFAGGINSANIVATVSNTGLAVTGNVSASGNVTVSGYLVTAGGYGNISQVDYITANNVIATANVTVQGIGVTMPNRPAFRVNGTSLYAGAQSTANVNLKGVAISTQYNQGNYFDATTGKFTAPIAGIYEVLLNARVNSSFNGLAQLVVLKNGLNTSGNVVAFWETTSNTAGATHFGVSGTVVLATGDYLSANILSGNVTFDNNDNWSVTYLG